MALSETTRDHSEIQRWAESRGAVPSEVGSMETSGGPGILRFQFPKARNRNDAALREIPWNDFFEKFDASQLEMVYQEKTAGGAKSNFNKLIHPENAKSPKRKASSAARSHSKSATSPGKKSKAA